MKKTIGPVVVFDTNPPYKRWDGNQATYLFFPVFASFILTLIGTISAPIIPGLSAVNVHAPSGQGVVRFGGWGMCIDGFPNEHIFDNNTLALAALPTGVLSMGISPAAVDDSYKLANGIMHVLACIVAWLATTWTLAACGEYEEKRKHAWQWTRWAWWGNTASLITGLVPFALDIALIPKTASLVKMADGSAGKVTAGSTIYMSAAATGLNFITLLVRYLWSRRQPRPSWATSDFLVDSLAPAPGSTVAGADKALPDVPQTHGDFGVKGLDDPPSWESLNLDSSFREDDKAEWSRADNALESIDEKRASLVRDGYAV